MSYTLDRDLYLTADRDRVVEDGDPEAAFLLGNAGSEVDDEEAERLGLTKAKKTAEPAEEPKAASQPANKKRTAAKNKAK